MTSLDKSTDTIIIGKSDFKVGSTAAFGVVR